MRARREEWVDVGLEMLIEYCSVERDKVRLEQAVLKGRRREFSRAAMIAHGGDKLVSKKSAVWWAVMLVVACILFMIAVGLVLSFAFSFVSFGVVPR